MALSDPLRLMAVLAHPDDESLGFGGTLARYASEGIETYLVTATRGERGRLGERRGAPLDEVGRIREQELLRAARVLGVREVSFLNYLDGELDRAEPEEAIGRIARQIGRVRPHVVMTFGPEGTYGHPDHIAISQFTTAAVVRAAPTHRVSKLYYLAWRKAHWDAHEAALKKLVSRVDGVDRGVWPWPEWAITTVIDTAEVWPVVWQAVSCHESQMSIYRNLQSVPEDQHVALWGSQDFYRVFSLVNGGRAVERDLFEGLRPAAEKEERHELAS
jgi:LmbE family N-acetylglucosaminyl deacetylase